ncbi:MAG TPA: phosphatidylglycerol lysyltransferase domain-containing protein [Chitinophagaceae bacterium]
MPMFLYRQLKDFTHKLHWKELLALFFILLAIFFFRQERYELQHLIPAIESANFFWFWCGVFVTIIYIFLQSGLYVFSFATVHGKIKWINAAELFVKRNLISVFLPAGGISSLAYLPKTIRQEQINKQQVHQASAVYAFIGIFSVFLVGVPVLVYLLVSSKKIEGAITGFILLSVILLLAILLVQAVRKRNRFYVLLVKRIPKFERFLNDFFSFKISYTNFWIATFFSVLIEFAGIAHLLIAMKAAGMQPSFEAAVVGYIVATIFLIISPFLRGLGAIELSLTVILQSYNFPPLKALTITFLFRIFEFWLPLAAGIISFALKGKDLFLRLFPPIMIFLLGVINIISVLTPPIASRVRLLKEYIPISSMQTSNLLVILMGLTLIITAHFLLRGLRSAWLLALTISIISCIGHLVKALDYEESLAALFVTIVLLLTSKQYRIKSNPHLVNIGVITGVSTFLVVLIFGSIGFYYLNVKHFGIDFTWKQSIGYSIRTFGLINNADLHPLTRFGEEFLLFIKVLGVTSWIFLFYTIIRPTIHKTNNFEESLQTAQYLLKQYGDSPLDYFKISHDKLLYMSENYEAFVSYRVANGFAIVLEEPVCSEGNKALALEEFEEMCKTKGLKPVYYRVDEDSLYHFKTLNRKKLLIGQEGILEIDKFSLEGRERKSLRNALNSLNKKGYKVQVHKAPQTGLLLQALQQVSDEWLRTYDMEETVFSQGMFNWNEIRSQDVITISDAEKKVVAFLNIIPDYTPHECTYDMIRKTNDAPGGCMDALIVELIKYAQDKGYHYANFGLAPMSGIEMPDNTAERVVKFAYEKIKRFRNYQGLRDFKEKFVTKWLNKYLVYQNDFDLIQLPAALNKVMQPVNKIKQYAK